MISWENTDFDQQLFKSVFDPLLKTDVIVATFYMFRKTPFSIEELKIVANDLDKISAVSFPSFTGLLSFPVALGYFSLFISMNTWLTLLNSKLVSTGSPRLGKHFSSQVVENSYHLLLFILQGDADEV